MKRTIRSLFAVVMVLLFVGSMAAPQANAARGWCLADPLILVDGQLADVFVSSDLAMLLRASGPIQIVISIPNGSKGQVILTDLGFLKGYKISFVQSDKLVKTKTHTPVLIRVYAPTKGTPLPVTVTFAPRYLSTGLLNVLFGTSASGLSNSWISLATN